MPRNVIVRALPPPGGYATDRPGPPLRTPDDRDRAMVVAQLMPLGAVAFASHSAWVGATPAVSATFKKPLWTA